MLAVTVNGTSIRFGSIVQEIIVTNIIFSYCKIMYNYRVEYHRLIDL